MFICLINFKRKGLKWRSVVIGRDLRDTLCGVAGIAILYPVVRYLCKSDIAVAIVGIILSVIVYFGILLLMRNEIMLDSIRKVSGRLFKSNKGS